MEWRGSRHFTRRSDQKLMGLDEPQTLAPPNVVQLTAYGQFQQNGKRCQPSFRASFEITRRSDSSQPIQFVLVIS